MAIHTHTHTHTHTGFLPAGGSVLCPTTEADCLRAHALMGLPRLATVARHLALPQSQSLAVPSLLTAGGRVGREGRGGEEREGRREGGKGREVHGYSSITSM